MRYGALHLRACSGTARHLVSNDAGLCSLDISSEGQRGAESTDNSFTEDNTKAFAEALRDMLQRRRFEYHSATF
jgi:hypothetical protein